MLDNQKTAIEKENIHLQHKYDDMLRIEFQSRLKELGFHSELGLVIQAFDASVQSVQENMENNQLESVTKALEASEKEITRLKKLILALWT